MATDLFDNLQTLRPSARSLEDGTNWPKWLINDYLTLLENLINISQAVDSETEINDELILQINQRLEALVAISGRLQGEVANLKKDGINNLELITALQASVSLCKGFIDSLIKRTTNLEQVTSGVSPSYLLGLIAKQEQRISNLEQQVT